MVDDAVTRASVEAACIEPGDVVLEVGPGTGVLTEELLHKGAQVVAVDKVLPPQLTSGDPSLAPCRMPLIQCFECNVRGRMMLWL